jgi:hypothetical protein
MADPILHSIVVAVASFIGSYAALRVHVLYLRRDLDKLTTSNARAHERIGNHEQNQLIHVPMRQSR